MSGAIPAELVQIANLQYLRLSRNALSSEIPAELGQLAKLFSLHLPNNELSGAIPAELGDLAKLVSLQLAGNPKLTGCIPYVLRAITANEHGLRTCLGNVTEERDRAALVVLYAATGRAK